MKFWHPCQKLLLGGRSFSSSLFERIEGVISLREKVPSNYPHVHETRSFVKSAGTFCREATNVLSRSESDWKKMQTFHNKPPQNIHLGRQKANLTALPCFSRLNSDNFLVKVPNYLDKQFFLSEHFLCIRERQLWQPCWETFVKSQ